MSTVRNPLAEPDPPKTAGGAPPPKLAAREHFIPFRKVELAETLAASPGLTPQERAQFQRLLRIVDTLLHGEYHLALDRLKRAYASFDPDADTRPGAALSPEQLAAKRDTLFERFIWLLERANFKRLAIEDVHRSVQDRSHWGLDLDLDLEIFERLEVFCRGDVVGTRFRRHWKNRFKSEAVDVPIYQRLVVIFRLREDRKLAKFFDTEDVHIKLFKDIPKVDLDMLLPGTKVKMSLFDRFKVFGPSLSGIALGLSKIYSLFFMAALNPYLALGVVGGTLGYSARGVYGYLNTRQKYQLNLTQSLYFQNLDNNSGAIHRLLDEAEEQENREVMLAYYFLWRDAPSQGLLPAEIDHRVEAYLAKHIEGHVDFEIADALDKLARLEIAQAGADGRWQALPIDAAIEKLGQRWIAALG